jgi:L-seryl-tRNA(Ser) seleniumtransferase
LVYERLGARAVLNARGIYSDLGAMVSPAVWAAMTEANETFAEMTPLLDAAGRHIAEMMGVEAGWVTPGASAAIALGTAACMSGSDTGAMARLPGTPGMRDTVVVQQGHRTQHASNCRMTGARLVEVDGGELPAALDPEHVACVFFPGHLDGAPGTRRIGEVIRNAHDRGIAVLVDAAFANYPPETMSRFTNLGADLVCFGATYFYGPGGGGFVCGRRDLVESVAALDFDGSRSADSVAFRRRLELDRPTIVGTALALTEWLGMDHEARWAGYARAVETIRQAVADLPDVTATPKSFTAMETLEPAPVNCVVVRVPDARAAHRALQAGDPSIVCHLAHHSLILAVDAMPAGDEETVARRLREVLAAA